MSDAEGASLGPIASQEASDAITFVDPTVQLCPFPAYRRLHAESPVYLDPVTGFYEITKFSDLWAVAQDAEGFSSEHPVYGDQSLTPAHIEQARLYREEGFEPTKTLINADEPAHRGYRSLVDRSFRPSRIKALEPYIRELANMLIDRFIDAGTCDFVRDFAVPLPLYVIADTIGVSRDNADNFKRWSDALVKVHEPGIDGDLQIRLTHEVIEMQHFFVDAWRQAFDAPKEDILGDLVTGQFEGRALNEREVAGLLQSILVAGNESTASALGSVMQRLIDNPGLEARLRAEPCLIVPFIEEVLRLDAPLQCQYRRPVEDQQLRDVAIPADSMVVLRFGAGNRDAERFPDPDAIDLDRRQIKQHLTFGVGIHSCLGMLLARAELRIALEQLLSRLGNFKASGKPEANPSYMVYGLASLPISFDATRGDATDEA